MNDPNGMVYANGEYHLFYQYHPDSDLWGPMHWGHAVSKDLLNWQHLPIALYPDEHGMIFSGSAVVDKNNTAGFGEDAIVAIFTHSKDYVQCQSLAYTTDSGRTWTKYIGNPVLVAPEDTPDFRDPKVFWYGAQDAGHWIMCLAVRDRIMFYTSSDLIHWTHSGEFGPGYGSTAGVWETPELFELRVDNGQQTRWILTVGVQDGAPAGGSGTQYFVGNFDGRIFSSENPPETVLWADYGADYYAAQSWNDEPKGRRLLIAWMNNWQYALLSPSSAGQRGVFSLIREVSLTRTENGIRLVGKPVPEYQKLRQDHFHAEHTLVKPTENLRADVHGQSAEIVAVFNISNDIDCFGFHVRVGQAEHTTISYNVKDQRLLVDRTHSGVVDFKDTFAGKHSAELLPVNRFLRLHIYVDSSSVEVFANNGVVTFTESIFPSEDSQGLELFVEGGDILVNSLDIYQLDPISFDVEEG
jgi:fructan beta-fructosidase